MIPYVWMEERAVRDVTKHAVLNLIVMTALLSVVGVTILVDMSVIVKIGIVVIAFAGVIVYSIVISEKISEKREQDDYYRKQRDNIELQLIIDAMRSEYPFIMIQNVTKDTCRVEYNETEGKDKHAAPTINATLDLVLNTIPEPIHRAEFQRKFSREALLKAYEEGQTTVRCCVKQKINDESHWMDSMAILYRSNDGDIHNVSMVRNIDDDLRKAHEFEEALSDAEATTRAKTNFLTSMSHEIRTPINAVLGMNTMILRETNQDNIREYARDVQNAANTLLGLMNDILDFAKIQSGKMEVLPAKYDLGPTIDELLRVIKPKAHEKGLAFEVKIDPETPALLVGDAVRIKQIMANLLNNAVKYTEKGSITFEVGYDRISKEQIDLLIAVTDTGIGMKPESIEAIFSSNYRLEENRNKNIEGTGLGLSITRELLSRMGSKLEIESTYGQGSTFAFKIEQKIWSEGTLAGTQERVAAQKNEDEAMENFHAPDAKILVIDDVEMNIVVVRSLLKRIGIGIDSALNGADGIELAKNNKYDIIFIDAMMPKMDGTETMENIRKKCPLNKGVPMIVLTANAVQGAKDEYLREGFTDYLAKPIESKLMEAMIKHYLSSNLVVPYEVEEEESEQEEFTGVLAEINKIPGIDVGLGIETSSQEEIYIKICKMFYDSGYERIKMIEDYFNEKDIQNYTIQVHALKSSARLLGHMEFSEAAKALEMAGRENDVETIERDTPALLEEYKRVVQALSEVYNTSENDDREEIPEDELKGMLMEMQEALSAFDHDTSAMIMDALEEYKLPDGFTATYSKLKTGMAEVDRDGMLTEIESYLQRCQ